MKNITTKKQKTTKTTKPPTASKPLGRPPKEKYNIPTMIKIINEYTENTELPILKEVCYKNFWDYTYMTKLQAAHNDLLLSIKRLLAKKEVQLEKAGLLGKVNPTMAIFSLKQLGWRDKQDIEISDNNPKLDAILKAVSDIV